MKINGKEIAEIRAESEVQIIRLEIEIEQLQDKLRFKKEMHQHTIQKIKNLDTLENLERAAIDLSAH